MGVIGIIYNTYNTYSTYNTYCFTDKPDAKRVRYFVFYPIWV